jgi:hypothetical protein
MNCVRNGEGESMIYLNETLLENYLRRDVILKLLNELSQPKDKSFTSHRWLLESPPKRMIYSYLYSDLLKPTQRPKRILDVGGGFSSLSRLILQNHNYTLMDIMVHDCHEDVRAVETLYRKCFWQNTDWYEFNSSEKFDIVVANDLFPNVDQRLTLFLEKYLSLCREMRLSLTYYNIPRFYHTRRIDADELLCFLAWDGEQLKYVLERFIDRLEEPDFTPLLSPRPSLFANNRQVCLIKLRGYQNV